MTIKGSDLTSPPFKIFWKFQNLDLHTLELLGVPFPIAIGRSGYPLYLSVKNGKDATSIPHATKNKQGGKGLAHFLSRESGMQALKICFKFITNFQPLHGFLGPKRQVHVKNNRPLVGYTAFRFGIWQSNAFFMAYQKVETNMETERVRELINGKEPMAIVRYFEWAIFSRGETKAKYLLLRLDGRGNDIREVDVPDGMVSFLRSRLADFDRVLHSGDGTVWERLSFRARARELVPSSKLAELIDLY